MFGVPMNQVAASRKINVLAVDDKPANLIALEAVLGSAYQMFFANSGAEAISLLGKRRDIDLILMDVQMPVMDGLTCTRRIRDMEKNGELSRHVPIIAVSANARKEQIDMAKEAGVDEAICKPFRIPELVGLMRGMGVRGE